MLKTFFIHFTQKNLFSHFINAININFAMHEEFLTHLEILCEEVCCVRKKFRVRTLAREFFFLQIF